MRAKVLRSAKRSFICEMCDSKEIVEAPALAALLKEDHIVVGDFVNLIPIESDSGYQIDQREIRKNEIYRMIPREQKKKVTAANCDLLILVTSVSRPEYKRGLVDRYLTRAFQWHIPAVVVFNKMDEYNEDDLDVLFETKRLEDIDVDCYEVSALNKSYKAKILPGIEALKDSLKGKTAIMLGQSGVGKSELISALSEGKTKLLSGGLGKIGKGTHTTTWSEIVNCGEFYLIDSPGVRSLSIDDIMLEELDGIFPDIANYATHCKFRNCTHMEEDKGCYFNDLDVEDEKSLMVLGRLESYMKFKEELSKTPFWSKKKP
ncbi:MAG: ribosome small subunit-dependent GTPase A [Bacteriovoracaceae bacterium]